MAVHSDVVQMIREALPEYIALARIGIATQKSGGGVLGYPSSTCLFAVVDAIGSYHREDPDFTVQIDGKARHITEAGQHIFILNSPYFGFDLAEKDLWALYGLGRSPLTHNAALGAGVWLQVGEPGDPAIENRDDGVHVNLAAFLRRCDDAVTKFLERADQIVPNSAVVRNLGERESATYSEQMRTIADSIAKSLEVEQVQVTAVGPKKRPGQPQ